MAPSRNESRKSGYCRSMSRVGRIPSAITWRHFPFGRSGPPASVCRNRVGSPPALRLQNHAGTRMNFETTIRHFVDSNCEHPGVVARQRVREFLDHHIAVDLAPGQILVTAEHPDVGTLHGSHAWDYRGNSWLLQVDRVQTGPLPSEPQGACRARGPTIRAVQGFLVHLHPAAQFFQYPHLGIRKGSIRFGGDA